MKTYQKRFTVVANDIDDLNHVNNVRYVQWVQDIAKEHWETVAKQENLTKFIWVVVSHHVEYKQQAFLGDPILVKTYIEKSSAVISFRNVEIYNADTQDLLAKAQTKWCLLDATTQKPTRIPQEVIDIFK